MGKLLGIVWKVGYLLFDKRGSKNNETRYVFEVYMEASGG